MAWKQCYKTVRSEHLTVDAELTLAKSRNKIHCISRCYMRNLIQPPAAEVLGAHKAQAGSAWSQVHGRQKCAISQILA